MVLFDVMKEISKEDKQSIVNPFVSIVHYDHNDDVFYKNNEIILRDNLIIASRVYEVIDKYIVDISDKEPHKIKALEIISIKFESDYLLIDGLGGI